MNPRAIRRVWILAVLILFFGPQPAYAYLDPGAGSYLIQFLMAAALGAAFTARLYWKRIIGFCARVFRKASKEDAGNA